MSVTKQPAALLAELTALEVDYWYDVDFNWGRTASQLYVEEGVFAIGDSRMDGRAAVAEFYSWREGRGVRTARHVVTNFRLEAFSGDSATLRCILLLYAADGAPVLPSLPAIMIGDIVSQCVRIADGRWRYRAHLLSPVFMSGEPPTVKPK
jgi:hypothetical protein